MICFKLFRKRKDGTLGSLFINRKQIIKLGEWLVAENHKTKGYAFRPGWHCCVKPEAPHLKLKEGRTWAEVEVEDFSFYNRPESQGGKWVLANKIKVVKEL